jgi:hypothetical protein
MNDVSRRTFLGSTAIASSLPSKGVQREVKPETRKRPNFVFFMPDEMRAESLACYGHPLVKTPNFDRLAREGVRFDQCHAQKSGLRAFKI